MKLNAPKNQVYHVHVHVYRVEPLQQSQLGHNYNIAIPNNLTLLIYLTYDTIKLFYCVHVPRVQEKYGILRNIFNSQYCWTNTIHKVHVIGTCNVTSLLYLGVRDFGIILDGAEFIQKEMYGSGL